MTYRSRVSRWIIVLVLGFVILVAMRTGLPPRVRASSAAVQLVSPTPTPTPRPPTQTPVPTRTPTASRTPTPQFLCENLSLSNRRLVGNEFRIDIQNNNNYSAEITHIRLIWQNVHTYAQTALAQMTLNAATMWYGPVPQSIYNYTDTDTDTNPGDPPFLNSAARTLNAQSTNVYAASFDGPPVLSDYVFVTQYIIYITVENPTNPSAPCELMSPQPFATATATPTQTSLPQGYPTPTNTNTPDCTAAPITIRFVEFEDFGIVRFEIDSQRTTTSTLKSFTFNWKKYVNSQQLVKVSLVAPPGSAGAVVVWDSGNVNEDANPSTDSGTEGTWLTDFTIPPGHFGSPSATSIYLDFQGIYRYDDYVTYPLYGGVSDFNFSTFNLSCDLSDAESSLIQITPEYQLSPTPITPSATPSPITPTATSTLTPTATATNTPTSTATPVTLTSVPNLAPIINYFTTDQPTLTWNRVSWASGYQIQISQNKNFLPAITQSLLPTTLSYTTDPLSNGTYYWRVKALGGAGSWSAVGTFVVSAPPPTASLTPPPPPTIASGN